MLAPESTLTAKSTSTVEPHFGCLKGEDNHSGDNLFLESKVNIEGPDHGLHERTKLSTMHGRYYHAKKVQLANPTQIQVRGNYKVPFRPEMF